MSSVLRDALMPLASKMPRAVRETEVLRVSARLASDHSISGLTRARNEILSWAQNRAGARFPKEAWDFSEFEDLTGGRHNSAVRLQTDAVDLWALRSDDPDKQMPGRTWTTEVVLGGAIDSAFHFACRLMVSTDEVDLKIEPAVPGFVRQLVSSPGLLRGGRSLGTKPHVIETDFLAEDLCDYILDPDRRLPVFLFTRQDDGTDALLVDSNAVALATTGLARCYVLAPAVTWVVTKRFGRVRSVFGGAVRVYMPGFSAVDDPYRHRLFLADRLASGEGRKACETWLRQASATNSLAVGRLGKEVLEFAAVRTASRRLSSDQVQRTGASDAEKLRIANQLVESLEQQVTEKERETNDYINLYQDVEERAEASEREYRSLLYRYRELELRVVSSSDASEESRIVLPNEWPELLDWVDRTFPDSVQLTPKARRLARNAEFDDVAQAARAILWLANSVKRRRAGDGGSIRDAAVEEGVWNSLCGGDEYDIDWHGRRHSVDWHIKSGGNTRDPRRCLRIYYFWEPEMEQIVIDHFPSHRETDAS